MDSYNENNSPLVSIIVPFFNIPECVEYCLSSLLDQTSDDYEIVVVDDGSTDETPLILDTYRDNPKIRIFHKANGGLSDARNYGVGKAHGDYITFVDGDDIVSPFYVEALISGINPQENDTLVVGTSKRIPYTKMGLAQFNQISSIRRIDHRAFYEKLLYEELLPSAWAHLAPKRVYEAHPFPHDMFYEEIGTIMDYAARAESICLIDEPIYGYVARDNSIVHNRTVSEKQIDDYLTAISLFSNAIVDSESFNNDDIAFFQALHYSRIYRLLEGCTNRAFSRAMQKDIVLLIRDKMKLLFSDKRIPILNKFRFALLALSGRLYLKIFDVFDGARR